jgi:hypothetical protein
MESDDSLPYSQELATFPILSQMNTVYFSSVWFLEIYFKKILPSKVAFASSLFPLQFLTKSLQRFTFFLSF